MEERGTILNAYNAATGATPPATIVVRAQLLLRFFINKAILVEFNKKDEIYKSTGLYGSGYR